MTQFVPTGLIADRNETLVQKVLRDALYHSLSKRVASKIPGSGYQLQEDSFCIAVNHAVGSSELTWGMWTLILTGMTAYVNAYPKYDFLFEVIVFEPWQLRNRKIGAGFILMRE